MEPLFKLAYSHKCQEIKPSLLPQSNLQMVTNSTPWIDYLKGCIIH